MSALDDLREAISPGVRDLKAVLPELGAVYDETASASKQGGGIDRINWRWPCGLSIDMQWMASLPGLLTMLQDWQVGVELKLVPNRQIAYWARVNDYEAGGRSAWGAIMRACVVAGMRPGVMAPLFPGPIKPPVGSEEGFTTPDIRARYGLPVEPAAKDA
jgi:hypothetical protein